MPCVCAIASSCSPFAFCQARRSSSTVPPAFSSACLLSWINLSIRRSIIAQVRPSSIGIRQFLLRPPQIDGLFVLAVLPFPLAHSALVSRHQLTLRQGSFSCSALMRVVSRSLTRFSAFLTCALALIELRSGSIKSIFEFPLIPIPDHLWRQPCLDTIALGLRVRSSPRSTDARAPAACRPVVGCCLSQPASAQLHHQRAGVGSSVL